MEVVKLEEIALVSVGINLWLRQEVRQFFRKSRSITDAEKCVALLTNVASKLAMAQHLKSRLIGVIEKLGYQLHLFLIKAHADFDFEAENIKWTIDGLIRAGDTLREWLGNGKGESSTISRFKLACETFDEDLIRRIGRKLSPDDRERIDDRNLFCCYWSSRLWSTRIFPDSLRAFAIGYDASHSLEANMFRHSVAVNNRAAILYFEKRLRKSDVDRLGLRNRMANQWHILEFAAATLGERGFAFVLSFLEMPVVNEKARRLVVENTDPKLMKALLDNVLRLVGFCGDLHYNIFRYLLLCFGRKRRPEVTDNLLFYALNLLAKGRLEKFDFLPDRECKKILRKQILDRLESRRGLAIFLTIHWNNHTPLLTDFLHWLADGLQEERVFDRFLSDIVRAEHYDPSTK